MGHTWFPRGWAILICYFYSQLSFLYQLGEKANNSIHGGRNGIDELLASINSIDSIDYDGKRLYRENLFGILWDWTKFCILIVLVRFIFVLFFETENYFLNFVKSNQIWIVITLFQLIWHQTEFRSVSNQSEKSNYNTKFCLIYKDQKKMSQYM